MTDITEQTPDLPTGSPVDYDTWPLGDWRGLTLKGPWDFPIAVPPAPDGLAPKRTENRQWNTHYRGPVLITAGRGWDPAGAKDPTVGDYWHSVMGDRPLDRNLWQLWAGHVVAIATIVDSHLPTRTCCKPWGRYSFWDTQLHHLILGHVRPTLDLPHLARTGTHAPDDLAISGRQQLWRVAEDVMTPIRPHLPTRTEA